MAACSPSVHLLPEYLLASKHTRKTAPHSLPRLMSSSRLSRFTLSPDWTQRSIGNQHLPGTPWSSKTRRGCHGTYARLIQGLLEVHTPLSSDSGRMDTRGTGKKHYQPLLYYNRNQLSIEMVVQEFILTALKFLELSGQLFIFYHLILQ